MNLLNQLKEELETDPELQWTYHCNFAMPAYDEGLDHKHANQSAVRIMQTFFGIDTSKHEHYEY